MDEGGSVNGAEKLQFDPDAYETVYREGLDAYSDFAAGLRRHVLESDERPSRWEPGDVNLVGALPEGTDALSLGDLVWLCHSVRTGSLERFHQEPKGKGSQSLSLPFRKWGEQYQDGFARYFPERHRLKAGRDLGRARHDDVWVEIEATGSEVAEALDIEPSPLTAFYALVRDHVLALAPLSATLGLEQHRIVAQTRTALQAVPLEEAATAIAQPFSLQLKPLDQVRRREAELQSEHGLSHSPALVFFAMLVEANPGFEAQLEEHTLERAIEKLAEAGERSLRVHTRAIADVPAENDALGFEPLVRGIHDLLSDPSTMLPLTIAVTAPWGAGKSSVMRQLERILRGGGSRDVRGGRSWITVSFPAWKYERSERLWAALSKAIYEQSQHGWSIWRRIRFRARLQWRRLDKFELLGRILLPPLALAAIAVALALADKAIGAAIAAVLGAAAMGEGGRVAGVFSDPFKRALESYASGPRYEDQLGFTSDADADVGRMTELLTEERKAALAVFVDDLDRCSPQHVVEVVEAINQIFNASEKSECLFVLGMDRDVVAASIEVAYKPMIDQLPVERREGFGLAFLAKLVQLSVKVPPPDPDLLGDLLSTPPVDESAAPGAAEEEIDAFAEQLIRQQPATLAELEHAGDAARDDRPILSTAEEQALTEATRLERSVLLTAEDSPDVNAAARAVMAHLGRNPREVKRFDNAFRLQLLVANWTPGCDLAFHHAALVAMGKWVALRLRWPGLAAEIDRDPALLRRLEESAGPAGDRGERTGLDHWLSDPGLVTLLKDDGTGHRISHLDARTFLRVA